MHEELARIRRGDLTSDDAVEELADLLELIHAAAKYQGASGGGTGSSARGESG